MAKALADQGIAGVFSYAGRTGAPVTQPLPQRVGGFGGVAGLVDYLRAEAITHILDATHPFAARMSAHAVEAARITGLPLLALERAPWQPMAEDRWHLVPDMAAAAEALPEAPARVFLAIGRQNLEVFAAKPQHHYLLRLVDAPESLPLPQTEAVVARGPFTLDSDLALLRAHRISHIVAKNAGGSGARAKLDAARLMGLPVILIDRPALPERPRADSVEAALRWLHAENLGV